MRHHGFQGQFLGFAGAGLGKLLVSWPHNLMHVCSMEKHIVVSDTFEPQPPQPPPQSHIGELLEEP